MRERRAHSLRLLAQRSRVTPSMRLSRSRLSVEQSTSDRALSAGAATEKLSVFCLCAAAGARTRCVSERPSEESDGPRPHGKRPPIVATSSAIGVDVGILPSLAFPRSPQAPVKFAGGLLFVPPL